MGPLDFEKRRRMAVVREAQRKRRQRPLGNKLQEIAARSPADVYAIEELADFVLDRLDARAEKLKA